MKRFTLKDSNGIIDCGGSVSSLGKKEYTKRYRKNSVLAHSKLCQLEDIEEEFDLSLQDYVALMQNGFYGFCEDEDHDKPYLYHFEHKDFDLDVDTKEIVVWWAEEEHDINKENVYKKYRLNDHGKTWFLTKEDLIKARYVEDFE